jgi:hypothetical protein
VFIAQPFLLERPGMQGAITAQTLYENRFSKSVCNTVAAEGPIFPKLVRRVFLKEPLPAPRFTSST